jgi:hypothetical protein
MRRTEMLQEIRKMRFEEMYAGWNERRLTHEEAARVLGVGERTFRRWLSQELAFHHITTMAAANRYLAKLSIHLLQNRTNLFVANTK